MEGQNGNPQTPAQSASASLNESPTTQPTFDSGGVPCTEAQAHELMDHAVQKGFLTRDQAQAHLAAEGRPPIPPPQPQNVFEQDFDRNFAPAKSHEYSLPQIQNGTLEETERAKQNQIHFRNWMSSAELPREIGNSLAETIKNESQGLGNIQSQAELKSWQDTQNSQLRRVWGDKYDQNVRLAQQFIDTVELKQPGLKAYLERNRLGDSAAVSLLIHGHAERLMARRGRF